jgi:peptide/nickel transport system permease protein
VARFFLISTLRAFLTLGAVSLLVFSLARVSGSPLDVMLPDTATPADRARVAQLWGLDKPVHEQYLVFVANAVHGDFGNSFKWQGVNAMGLVLERLPNTLQLTLLALLVTLVISIPLGVSSAVNRGTWVDGFGKLVALLGQSVPAFWLAIMLVWVFSVNLGWLPTSGQGGWQNLVMPVIVIGTFGIAAFTRVIRSSMLEVLDSEYIKLARLKGLSETRVIWKHALKNAAIAPLTLFGTILVNLITGSVVVETIYSWPGIGQLAVDATSARDYQVVQAVALLSAAVFIFLNLVVDLLYGILDPRVRLGAS